MGEVTTLLQSLRAGDTGAAEKLLPLVYDELRLLAARKMARETPGQTLQATALVHEAWLRLAGTEEQPWQDRSYFFAASAEAMRRILIDNARRKKALRHGAGAEHVDIGELQVADTANDEQLLAVHEALDELGKVDSTSADLVKLRYFVGMTMIEAAEALHIPLRSAERLWAYAKAWLKREMERE